MNKMKRREFLRTTFGVTGAALLSELGLAEYGSNGTSGTIDVKEFNRMRRFADLPMGRVAYVERGTGLAALFLHGFPLNGYQWRGALERLSTHRRCIAADFIGLGYTEAPEGQDLSLPAQADMLAALLDHLAIDQVDLVANDSGGLIAQLFIARHPSRVRTLLLTNCDVDENSPPAAFLPLIQAAKKGNLAANFIGPQIADKKLARSDKGLGVAYTQPDNLAPHTIDCYLAPLVSSPLRMQQFNQYTVEFEKNLLVPIRPELKQFSQPARMVWALSDIFFGVRWADWLDHTFPNSQGVRKIEGAKLFFPEEMPDIIAEEALTLWSISPVPQKQPAHSTL
jgi:haloalkane dehalogenase